jgi:uncharacterized membrane protein YqjE
MSTPASSAPESAHVSVPRIVIEGLMHRGELLGLELREARAYLAHTTLVGALAGAAALLTGFAATFAIAAAVWDHPRRGLIMALVTLAYLAVAAGCIWWTSRRLKAWRPFTETAYQLREDCTCLNRYLSENSR